MSLPKRWPEGSGYYLNSTQLLLIKDRRCSLDLLEGHFSTYFQLNVTEYCVHWGRYEYFRDLSSQVLRKLFSIKWGESQSHWIILHSNFLSMEICDPRNNITMCPLCDRACSYWKLVSACGTARASHLFDNPATVFFSVFMALWGTMLLSLIKLLKSYSITNHDINIILADTVW